MGKHRSDGKIGRRRKPQWMTLRKREDAGDGKKKY